MGPFSCVPASLVPFIHPARCKALAGGSFIYLLIFFERLA